MPVEWTETLDHESGRDCIYIWSGVRFIIAFVSPQEAKESWDLW